MGIMAVEMQTTLQGLYKLHIGCGVCIYIYMYMGFTGMMDKNSETTG